MLTEFSKRPEPEKKFFEFFILFWLLVCSVFNGYLPMPYKNFFREYILLLPLLAIYLYLFRKKHLFIDHT
jgi:hypothetical protein